MPRNHFLYTYLGQMVAPGTPTKLREQGQFLSFVSWRQGVAEQVLDDEYVETLKRWVAVG